MNVAASLSPGIDEAAYTKAQPRKSVGCVGIATDGHNTLGMLKRRAGETLVKTV